MILYHGTSETSGKQILLEKKLRCRAVSAFDSLGSIKSPDGKEIKLSTTKGYVYFTNDIFKAYRYGYSASRIANEEHVFIFKIDMSENRLLPDNDEADIKDDQLQTVSQSFEKYASCCVKGDIQLQKQLHCWYTHVITNVKILGIGKIGELNR